MSAALKRRSRNIPASEKVASLDRSKADVDDEEPSGIHNFSNACFANCAIHAVAALPMAEQLSSMAGGTLKSVDKVYAEEPPIGRTGASTRRSRAKVDQLQTLFKEQSEHM